MVVLKGFRFKLAKPKVLWRYQFLAGQVVGSMLRSELNFNNYYMYMYVALSKCGVDCIFPSVQEDAI